MKSNILILIYILITFNIYCESQLLYGDLVQINSVNPIVGGNPAEKRLYKLLFNGLLKERTILDLNNKRYNLKIVTDISKDYEYDNQNNIWKFSLKDNVKFHDGSTRVDVKDVYSTIGAFIDDDNDINDKFYMNYIESCYYENDIIYIKLKKEPWNLPKLFMFPILSDEQLSETGRKGLNKDLHNKDWWDLSINSEIMGTGPYMLYDSINHNNLDIIELFKFNEYFNNNPDNQNPIDTIIYNSYSNSNLISMVQNFKSGRKINLSIQSYGLDTDEFNIIENGNDNIYYLGFNYRKNRKLQVVTFDPNKRGVSRRFKEIKDINFTDLFGDNNIGIRVKQYIMQGLNRLSLLSLIEKNKTPDELEYLIQRSIFPVYSPFNEREEILRSEDKYIQNFKNKRMYDLLNDILNKYLKSQDKTYFEFTSANLMKELDFTRKTLIEPLDGFFTLNGNPNEVLSLTLIYMNTDIIFQDLEKIKKELIETMLKLGIHLELKGINKSNFISTVNKGDWDLIITSYEVPKDYNISRYFSNPEKNIRENLMAYLNPAIEALTKKIQNTSSSVTYSEYLEQLNNEVLKNMAMIPLFGMPQKTAFRKSLILNDYNEFQRELINYDTFFDNVESWEIRN